MINHTAEPHYLRASSISNSWLEIECLLTFFQRSLYYEATGNQDIDPKGSHCHPYFLTSLVNTVMISHFT